MATKKTTTTTANPLLSGKKPAPKTATTQPQDLLGLGSGGGSIDWNNPAGITQTQAYNAQVDILAPGEGDSLNIRQFFPSGSYTIAQRRAQITKLSASQQQQLGQILAEAGVIAPSTKGYRTSDLQSGIVSALEQTGESGQASLSSFLGAVAQSRAAAGLTDVPGATLTPPQAQGQVAEMANTFSTDVQNYGLGNLYSNDALQQRAQAYQSQGMSISEAEGEFMNDVRQTAAGLYPTLEPQLSKGVTLATLLDPYKQMAQSVLGIDGSTINWQDPKWSKALSGGLDPDTGRQVPMSLDQWGRTMRSDATYGWQNTDQAKAQSASLAMSLLRYFGEEPSTGLSISSTTQDAAGTAS